MVIYGDNNLYGYINLCGGFLGNKKAHVQKIGVSYNKYNFFNSRVDENFGYSFASTIGDEYFLIDKFSLGAEIFTKYEYIKYKSEDKNLHRLDTFTHLIIRVYLF